MINPTIKEFWIAKNTFHILPALLIRFDDIMYRPPNVAISFHWLWFNGWVMWQK